MHAKWSQHYDNFASVAESKGENAKFQLQLHIWLCTSTNQMKLKFYKIVAKTDFDCFKAAKQKDNN